MPLTNLSDYKDKKRVEFIIEELEAVLAIIRLAMKGLKLFKYYSPVQDILNQMRDSKTILEIHLNNHKQMLVKKEDDNG